MSQEPTHKTEGSQECYLCGKTGHHASECWCKNLVCRQCGIKGHIERACKQKKKRPVAWRNKKENLHTIEQMPDDQGDTLSEEEVPCYVLSLKGGSYEYWVTPLLDGKPNIKPGSQPKYLKARTVPYAIRPKVEADLERLVKNGVLIPVTHSPWATPIVPILKKDGSIRICGDFKVTVNPVLCAEQYPLPRIDDIFAGLAGGQRFSKIDLSQAYLQMQVDEESQELLTIVTHKGLYRYCRLPFGITSAPALFQRAMDQILCGLPGVQCYLDDILVTGGNEEDHLKNLEATLQRLEEYGLRVRKDKCAFFQPSVEYLGHIIDATGLHKSPSKVKAIVEAPPPQNVSQLRSFLGLLNYYGRFISQLATLLKPLHELLGQNKVWKWTDACDVAFNKAKCALLNAEVLTHFDPSLPLQLACDASPYGVGVVLSHVMPSREEKPIAFASRTLSTAETNYAQIEREALGIVFGIQKFHQYLFGRKFTLLTDHRPLTAIFGPHSGIPPMAASRMQRWALWLSGHTYEIRYRKATLHGNADGLSRLQQMLEQVHSGHCGMVHMKEIAQSYFWWPGLNSAIEEKARACISCQCVRKAPHLAPLHPWGRPEKPWQHLHIDFAGLFEEQLVSDNGSQFVSQEFGNFMKANRIHHIISVPYHPSMNGLAERFVQT
nr:uncharacterized protein K02A2.6-like [Pelodiscus sinensis]|eukprot:XP_025043376.1 uncharacterized protein K02A2.6-like [Pelodiscus sinensis]